jgi:predicted nucleic acid-binding protein
MKEALVMVLPNLACSQNLPIVVDTSVLINLNACGVGSEIVSGMPNEFVVVNEVLEELGRGCANGHSDSIVVSRMLENRYLRVVSLCEKSITQFERLVSGCGERTLGDGEAATISYGLTEGIGVAIDEKKARRICSESYSALTVLSTIDLFRMAEATRIVDRDTLAAGVYSALVEARMNVDPGGEDWVLDLIGEDRAKRCSSLCRILRRKELCA